MNTDKSVASNIKNLNVISNLGVYNECTCNNICFFDSDEKLPVFYSHENLSEKSSEFEMHRHLL